MQLWKSQERELRTDPERLREIERNLLNTRIDWAALASWEGGQRLEGHVPAQGGRVMGRSGVTVATGVDLRARTKEELKAHGLGKGRAWIMTHQFGMGLNELFVLRQDGKIFEWDEEFSTSSIWRPLDRGGYRIVSAEGPVN